MSVPRVVAVDATSVTVANDPEGVASELVLALLSDLGDSWFKQLGTASVTAVVLGPTLRAERVRSDWRFVRETGAHLTLSFDDVDRLSTQAWSHRHAFRMENFPLGASLDRGRYQLRESLHGGPDRGMYRAFDHRDNRTVLVTLGPPQREDVELMRSRLAFAIPGITKLLHVGPLVTDGELPYDGLVEEEPAGQPSTLRADAWPLDRTIAVGLAVADVVRAVHARGASLGGLRPELVYLAADAFTSLAPRCEPFLSATEKRNYAVPPCFATYYMSPEQLARGGAATPADDTFAIAAMLATWHTGEHPFQGELAANAIAIATGARRTWHGDSSLEAMVGPALVAEPKRISLDELCGLLREIA